MLEIFHYDFMVRAFEAGLAVAVIAPLIGIFLVVRRYSLMADTLAHVSFAGIAIGIFLGVANPVYAALVASVVAALGIDRLRGGKKIFGESVLAIFLSGSLAIAVIVVSLAHGFNVNLLSFLFGSVATVSGGDVALILGMGVLVVASVAMFYKELFFIAFDEELAAASGLKVRVLNALMMVLAAVTVSLSIRVVGVLLIGALMVIPVISAMQFGRGFRDTLLGAIILSVSAVVLGLFGSYYLDIPSGGAIVATALVLFLGSLISGKTS
ncbi:MAG: metal ABC transporter permease [Candidatus Yonathbacteria bacterium RIFCSPHIGHO2_01_FULL_51_10]|uniref:Metal ABC transporter permease n=1 Tax=Candidatus Yonathbacteria bacterium RIFCSPHIGHO2_01_FULL_51_10 TaxID=1802723 RepID=A0A1G2SCY3_9BACT|nr:MAG: metal ABC transporter permease [Candidatus Yonathbacteria bacterium RIFCSPHIGHO2_01_FULL_51_10]